MSQVNYLLDQLVVRLVGYRDIARVKNDVLDLISNVPSLAPRVNDFMSNDGISHTWLQLYGTIPIHYRQSQYNVPVHFWITDTYPISPPLCFVAPTSTMRIKQSHQHVNMQGLITIEPLRLWNHVSSNLFGLIIDMESLFSVMPPVVAVSAGNSNPQPYSQPHFIGNDSLKDIPSKPILSKSSSNPAAIRKDALVIQVTNKIRENIRKYHSESQQEVLDLISKQSKLEQHARQVEQDFDSAKEKCQQLEKFLSNIDSKIDELRKWLSENNDIVDKLDANDCVKPLDTWATQMIDSVAVDQAIEDILYILDRALLDESIKLSDFLKHVRKLTRDQFFARTMINKVYELQSKTSDY